MVSSRASTIRIHHTLPTLFATSVLKLELCFAGPKDLQGLLYSDIKISACRLDGRTLDKTNIGLVRVTCFEARL